MTWSNYNHLEMECYHKTIHYRIPEGTTDRICSSNLVTSIERSYWVLLFGLLSADEEWIQSAAQRDSIKRKMNEWHSKQTCSITNILLTLLNIDTTPLQEEEGSQTKENRCNQTSGDILQLYKETDTYLNKRGLLSSCSNNKGILFCTYTILKPVKSKPMARKTILRKPNNWGITTPLYALNI